MRTEDLRDIYTSDLDGTLISGLIPVPSLFVDALETLLETLQRKELQTHRPHGSTAVKSFIQRMSSRRNISAEDYAQLKNLSHYALSHRIPVALLTGRQSYLEHDTEELLQRLRIRQFFQAVYLNMLDQSSLAHKYAVTSVLAQNFENLHHVEDDARVAFILCEEFPQLSCYLIEGILNNAALLARNRVLPKNLTLVRSFAEASEYLQRNQRPVQAVFPAVALR